MSYYTTCPRCGAHLDPGETCDCLQGIPDNIVKFYDNLVKKLEALGWDPTVAEFEHALEHALERVSEVLDQQTKNAPPTAIGESVQAEALHIQEQYNT